MKTFILTFTKKFSVEIKSPDVKAAEAYAKDFINHLPANTVALLQIAEQVAPPEQPKIVDAA